MRREFISRSVKNPFFLCLGSLIFFFVINVLIRLPLYFSNNFWFDGDEAIIGIMAQDFLRTGQLPFFFYGQHYGFASVETFFAAMFIQLLGSKVIALKLAGILIHSLALSFITLTFSAKKIPFTSQLFLLCLILFLPSYYLWASQMRSTAFLLACILFYLTETQGPKLFWICFVFALSFLLLEAQAMFYIFSAALIANWLWLSSHKWIKLLSFFGLQLVLLLLLTYTFSQGNEIHNVRISFNAELWAQFLTQASGILSGFNGFHYFTVDINTPIWYKLVSLFLMAFFFILLFRSLWKNKKREPSLLFFYLGVLFVFVLFLSGFEAYGPRYWINFFGGSLLILLHLHVNQSTAFRPTLFHWLLPIFMCSTLFAASHMKVHFTEDKLNETKAFQELENAVFRSNRKALFTSDSYIQWQWNYLNGDKIPCSSFFDKERTKRFTNGVFKAYSENPNNLGCIGLWGIFLEMDFVPGFNDERYQVGNKYYFLKEMKPEYYLKARKTSGYQVY